eukprot:TRINITY_DN8508_c0_g1_i1.p1 TRINITY_DN8508_c0_g1~~TRINITY_DN8508_c0_g1_i1.p1  ORF type:complete len:153 (+),score=42.15 TRINITY_DN8508_c0_g1_i1:108-566(+)
MSTERVIQFYKIHEKYGCFSNFSHHPVQIDGLVYPTTEHYFQAMKFPGTEYSDLIRQASTPGKSKQMGQTRAYPLRADWEEVKEEVMKTALLAKFQQHPEIRKILLETNDAMLVERTDGDSYWGDGRDGNGKNRLGFVMMQVREILKKESTA